MSREYPNDIIFITTSKEQRAEIIDTLSAILGEKRSDAINWREDVDWDCLNYTRCVAYRGRLNQVTDDEIARVRMFIPKTVFHVSNTKYRIAILPDD